MLHIEILIPRPDEKENNQAESSTSSSDNVCKKLENSLTWKMFIDGSSNAKRAGVGLLLISLEGTRMYKAFKFGFKATNNEAKYEALFVGLWLAKEMRAELVNIRSDSQLIVNQIVGEYQAKGDKIIVYLNKAKAKLATFKNFAITQIPQGKNSIADALAKLVSSQSQKPRTSFR